MPGAVGDFDGVCACVLWCTCVCATGLGVARLDELCARACACACVHARLEHACFSICVYTNDYVFPFLARL